uniref:hypothetical protein n=2 Tax=Roseivirga sp. TaxID=1964215 RepID=UPI0040479F39
MSYKLKQESISSFSNQVAAIICSKLFTNNEKVDGRSLVSLTRVPQINAFVVKSLLAQWHQEMQKLESPYFDFKHKEVQKALKDFMNVLSNHISIGKTELEALLAKAIEDTLLFSFEPKPFLLKAFKVNPNFLESELKYFKTHADALNNLSKQGIQNLESQIDKLSNSFDEVSAVNFLNQLNAENKLDFLFEKVEERTAAPLSESREPTSATKKENVYKKVEETSEKPQETLNDKFNTNTSAPTLAAKLQKKVTQPIDKSLTLNERIMFTNSLFKGDKDLLNKALSQIDTANSLSEAVDIALTFNQGWKMDSGEIEAFMEVIERKFN